jgi:hypothetical protein
LQRAAVSAAPPAVPPIVHEVLSSSGQPLDAQTRAFMEPRFGHDFSGVRIHTNSQAALAADSVNAIAFTVGQHIAFGRNQYAPNTIGGKELVAHELAHVVQQASFARQSAGLSITDPSEVAEVQAERAAEAISVGQLVTGLSVSTPTLARQDHGSASARGNVSLVELSCMSSTITFHTASGPQTYLLSECDLTDGDYDAAVIVRDSQVQFDLGMQAAEGRRFSFGYDIEPGQPNPSTFFGSQTRVRVVARGTQGFGLDGGIGLQEVPVIFVAEPIDAADATAPAGNGFSPSGAISGAGMSLHMLASGDLTWMPQGDRASHVLSRRYWSPLLPSRGAIALDRLLDELPRDLAPRIEAELASGQRLSWMRGVGQTGISFTEAQLRSIPDLVRRFNAGQVLSSTEISLLAQVSELHVGGSTPGAPFASYTRPNYEIGFPRRYRVRVEIPRGNVLDVSQPNAVTRLWSQTPNIDEMEFMATANHEGRIVSVERAAPSGRPGVLMRYSGAIRWGGRILWVAGAAYSGYRVATAAPEERTVVAAEEVGSMAGGAAGSALVAAGCLALGAASGGVGLLVCGLLGGAIGAGVGSWAAGGLARDLQQGTGGDSRACPSCHALQREWEQQRTLSNLSGFPTNADLFGSGLDQPNLGQPLSTRGVPGTLPLTQEELDMIRRWIGSGR